MKISEDSCNFEKYVQCFYAYLDGHKLKRSVERNAILLSVFDFDKHFTIEDLQNRLKEQKHHVSRSTLYATLGLLIDAGLVFKHHLPCQATAQYEKFFCSDAHNHIYTEGSEKMIEFYDNRIDEIKKDIEKKYGVDVVQHAFTLYCKKKS